MPASPSFSALASALTRYALPLSLSALFLSLPPLAELSLSSSFLGGNASAQIGAALNLHYLFSNAASGLALGGALSLSRSLGASSPSLSPKILLQALLSLLPLFGTACAILLFFAASPLLELLSLSPALLPPSAQFLRLSALSLPFLSLLFAVQSALAALGNAAESCALAGLYALSRVLLGALALSASPTVSALAISGVLSAALWGLFGALFVLLRARNFLKKEEQNPLRTGENGEEGNAKQGVGEERKEQGKGEKRGARGRRGWHAGVTEVLRAGVPLVVLNVSATLSFTGIAALVNRAGRAAGAEAAYASGYAAVIRMNNFVLLPLRALSGSVGGLSARAAGEGRYELSPRFGRVAGALGVGIALPFFLLVLCFASPLLRFAGATEGSGVLAIFFRLSALDYLLTPLLAAACGSSDGSGRTVYSMAVSALSSLLVRLPLAMLFLRLGIGLIGVGVALPLSSLIALLALLLLRAKVIFARTPPV